MICKMCNQNIPDGSNYCPYCQAKTQPELNIPDITQNFHIEPQIPNIAAGQQQPHQSYTPVNQQPANSYASPHPPSHQTPYNNQQQQYGNSQAPAGYTYDPASGKYYISNIVFDPNSNQSIRQVVYYDHATQVYTTVNYPMNHVQGVNSNHKPIIIIVAIVVAFIIALSLIINTFERTFYRSIYDDFAYDNPFSNYESYNDYDYRDNYDDYSNEEISTARNYNIADSDIRPFAPSGKVSGNGIDIPGISFNSEGVIEHDGYLYFFPSLVYENEKIVRYDIDGGGFEVISEVDDYFTYFSSMIIIDNKLIYSYLEEYDDYAAYHIIDLDTMTDEFMFYEADSSIGFYNGYLYLTDYYDDDEIIKIGYDSDDNFVSKGYSISLPDSFFIYSSFSIKDNFLYFLANDYSENENVYKINLDNFTSTLIFQGEKDYSYDDLYIDGNEIYYLKYKNEDSETSSNHPAKIAKSELGKVGSEVLIADSNFNPFENTFFMHSQSRTVYSDLSVLTSIDVNDSNKILNSEDIQEDFEFISANWAVYDGLIVSLDDFSSIPYDLSDLDPLV